MQGEVSVVVLRGGTFGVDLEKEYFDIEGALLPSGEVQRKVSIVVGQRSGFGVGLEQGLYPTQLQTNEEGGLVLVSIASRESGNDLLLRNKSNRIITHRIPREEHERMLPSAKASYRDHS
jgi:hypothetical protein